MVLSWALGAPVVARGPGGLVWGVGLSAAAVLGLVALSMFLGLVVAGVGGEWEELVGVGVVLLWASAGLAGVSLCGGLGKEK